MTKPVELRSVALHHGVNAEGLLYRLKRGTVLRLVPGPSLLGRSVALQCNYPVRQLQCNYDGEFLFCLECSLYYMYCIGIKIEKNEETFSEQID